MLALNIFSNKIFPPNFPMCSNDFVIKCQKLPFVQAFFYLIKKPD